MNLKALSQPVRKIKVSFRLHPSPRVPEPPPYFSEPPREQVALEQVLQKVRIKEADDSLEVPGKRVRSLSGFCSPITASVPPSPMPHLLVKNLLGEATAFMKLPLYAKCC